jgi:hypothetical protein
LVAICRDLDAGTLKLGELAGIIRGSNADPEWTKALGDLRKDSDV